MSAGSEDKGHEWSAAFTSNDGMEVYENVLVGPVFLPWAEYLLDALRVAPGERLLDVATGPGTVARLASARLRRRVKCWRPTSVPPCSRSRRRRGLSRMGRGWNTASAPPRHSMLPVTRSTWPAASRGSSFSQTAAVR